MTAILEASILQSEKRDQDDDNDPPNGRILVLDATCRPADITYPQDVELLDQAREQLEKAVDEICKTIGQQRPRMYHQRTCRDFLRLSKRKKRNARMIRFAVKKQANRLNLVTTIYEQQRIMFDNEIHSIPRRIVSLAQPLVRLIVRGKAHANTEFGAKLHISLVDGYARVERLDFEPYNESEDFWRAVQGIITASSAGRSISWRIRSTGTGRRWRSTKNITSVCQAQPWASRPKIQSSPIEQRSRSIRTVATATLWRVFSVQVRPLMARPASRHIYKKLLSA